MDTPALSIVCPVFNEAAALSELLRRLTHSARQTGLSYELLLVDDASTDESPRLFSALASEFSFRVIRQERRGGQFRATRAGLLAARGEWIVVLDGDLQDPPEVIVRLLEAQRACTAEVGLVLAVKRARHDSLPFRAALAVHHAALALFAERAVPLGAGSFCLMKRDPAKTIAALPLENGNLSAFWGLLDVPFIAVSYEKAARYDAHSRVGAFGLIAESLWSLWIAGALAPLLACFAALSATAGLVWRLFFEYEAMIGLLGAFSAAFFFGGAALLASSRRRRLLRIVRDAYSFPSQGIQR